MRSQPAARRARTPAPRRLVIGTFGPDTVGRGRWQGRHKLGPEPRQLGRAVVKFRQKGFAYGTIEHGRILLRTASVRLEIITPRRAPAASAGRPTLHKGFLRGWAFALARLLGRIPRRQKRLCRRHPGGRGRGSITGDRRQNAQGIDQSRIDPKLLQGTLQLFLAGGTTPPAARGFRV